MRHPRYRAFFLCACVALHARLGQAQPTSGDKAIATQLFDDAEKLMAAGNSAAACPKYAESQHRDPQLGTLLHLADCQEKIGKPASAWAGFKEALEIAARRNASGLREPREQTARARAEALEPRLSRLTITVAHAGTAGLEIRQSGELVDRAVWGSAMPIDPGVYTMTAYAPGKNPWTKMVEVTMDGADIHITVPLLENESVHVQEVAATAPTDRSSRTVDAIEPAAKARSNNAQRSIGLLVGGIGVASLGMGAAFGLMSNAEVRERDGICPTGRDCSRGEGEQIANLTNEARVHAKVFNIAVGVGSVVFLGGVVLILSAPSPSNGLTALRIQTWGGPAAGGASVGSQW